VKLTLSSKDLPPGLTNRARMDLYQEQYELAVGRVENTYIKDVPFDWDIEAVPLTRSAVFRGDGSAVAGIRRTGRAIAADGREEAAFFINRSGRVWYIDQGGQSIEVPQGAAVLLAQNRPYDLNLNREGLLSAELLSWLFVPSVLPQSAGPADSAAGQVIPASSPVLALISDYMERLLASGDSAAPSLLRMAERHLAELFALALGTNDALEQVNNGGLKAARLAAILASIEQHYADPGFSTERVAERLGISARQVHRLLEETSRSFYEHLLEYRLQRVHQMLADPAFTNCKIADLAGAAGFTNLSYFNRAFRARFGDTPTGVRATAVGNGALQIFR
jgi:AraC-like DNA-binding protein